MDHALREYMDMFTGEKRYSYFGQEEGWHKLGNVIGRDSNKSAETLFNDMFFAIGKQQAGAIDPSTGEFVPVEGWFFTQEILPGGIGGKHYAPVSKGYRVIQPQDLMRYLDIAMNGETPETLGAINEGRSIFVTYNMQPFDIKGDPHKLYLSLVDRYAGDGRLVAKPLPFRLQCANTIALSGSFAHVISLSHRGDMSERLQQELSNIMSAAKSDGPRVIELFTNLANKSVTQEQADEILKKLFPAEEREWKREAKDRRAIASRNMIAVLFDGAGEGMNERSCRGTAFGFVNAVAQFMQHDIKNLSGTHHQKDGGIAVATDSLFGDAARKIEQAVEMVVVR